MLGLEPKAPLKLTANAALVKASYTEWHRTLALNAIAFGSAMEIQGSDVRFRRLKRGGDRLRAEFWVGASEAAAVQINQPRRPGSENSASGIGIDRRGRRFVLRQADLHGNNASERIRDAVFAARTGLAPVEVELRKGPATRQWHVVAPLDAAGNVIRAATADFVRRCWGARTWGRQAETDQKRLAALLGKPERGGWYDLLPDPTPRRVLHLQGFVFEALEALLDDFGIEIEKPRHAAGYEVDGVIRTSKEAILVEIKTGRTAADVYCGVGQLTLYPMVLPDLRKHRKILLLPGRPSQTLSDALLSCDVELHRYQMTRSRRAARVLFSKEFLLRCGVDPATLSQIELAP